jgi:hypothetical protein
MGYAELLANFAQVPWVAALVGMTECGDFKVRDFREIG